jgi:hypothetical protein
MEVVESETDLVEVGEDLLFCDVVVALYDIKKRASGAALGDNI